MRNGKHLINEKLDKLLAIIVELKKYNDVEHWPANSYGIQNIKNTVIPHKPFGKKGTRWTPLFTRGEADEIVEKTIECVLRGEHIA